MPRRDRAQIDIRPALPAVYATLDKSLAKSGTELPEIVVDTGNPACPQTNPDRVTTLNSTASSESSNTRNSCDSGQVLRHPRSMEGHSDHGGPAGTLKRPKKYGRNVFWAG